MTLRVPRFCPVSPKLPLACFCLVPPLPGFMPRRHLPPLVSAAGPTGPQLCRPLTPFPGHWLQGRRHPRTRQGQAIAASDSGGKMSHFDPTPLGAGARTESGLGPFLRAERTPAFSFHGKSDAVEPASVWGKTLGLSVGPSYGLVFKLNKAHQSHGSFTGSWPRPLNSGTHIIFVRGRVSAHFLGCFLKQDHGHSQGSCSSLIPVNSSDPCGSQLPQTQTSLFSWQESETEGFEGLRRN